MSAPSKRRHGGDGTPEDLILTCIRLRHGTCVQMIDPHTRQVLLTTMPYESREQAYAAAALIHRHAGHRSYLTLTQGASPRSWRFSLRAADGALVATSLSFPDEASARAAMELVIRHGPFASVDWVASPEPDRGVSA